MGVRNLFERLKSSRVGVWGRTEVDEEGPWEHKRWLAGVRIKFGGGKKRARRSKTVAKDIGRQDWSSPLLESAEGDDRDPLSPGGTDS